jgi:hypothetical protein
LPGPALNRHRIRPDRGRHFGRHHTAVNMLGLQLESTFSDISLQLATDGK